jgi:hypothetical protein
MTRLSDSAQHVVQRLPVVCKLRKSPIELTSVSVCLIVGSWLLFITFVSVKQVLLVRGDTGRFIMQ